ncbi:aromatic-ring-hydroxylating dioxygenase subunit beta [Bacillaceae bacterium]
MEHKRTTAEIGRAEIEDFLYHEASLLDEWRLDDWLELVTDDAVYHIPPNDELDGDYRDTLFLVADDYHRLKSRVKRLKSRHAHAENPHSRTRRFISNVRITGRSDDTLDVTANFIVYRYRRHEQIRTYVGKYQYKIRLINGNLKIAERRVLLDPEELGNLGSVSILL